MRRCPGISLACRSPALWSALAAAVVSLGCAAIHPPITAEQGTDAPAVEPLRADAEGLKFALRIREAVPGDDVEIWRREPDGDWNRLETFEVDDELAEALGAGQIEWRDRLDERPRALEYRLMIRSDDAARTVGSRTVDWQGWPEPPAVELDVEGEDTPKVAVNWQHTRPLEARLLRRDVLAGDGFEPVAIVDPAAGNRFFDTDVNPGGVYTYRMQFVDRRDSIPRYSRYIDSEYVSVPE